MFYLKSDELKDDDKIREDMFRKDEDIPILNDEFDDDKIKHDDKIREDMFRKDEDIPKLNDEFGDDKIKHHDEPILNGDDDGHKKSDD